jgi:hypothetical protein
VRQIDGKKVDISDEEFEYYLELVKGFSTDTFNGVSYFENLFEVDNMGFITAIKPTKSVPWMVLFFAQQIMISQRLRYIDEFRQREIK